MCLSFSLTIDTIDKNLDVVLAGLRVDLSCWMLTVNSAADNEVLALAWMALSENSLTGQETSVHSVRTNGCPY